MHLDKAASFMQTVAMKKVLILNGPNLNLLGRREESYYGNVTLQQLQSKLIDLGNELGLKLDFFQNNSEGLLIDYLHNNLSDFIIFNPAAYTHTSIALRDALLGIRTPFIEIHLSNIFSREAFRHHSYFSDIAIGMICGLGTEGYLLALRHAYHYLQNKTKETTDSWIYEKYEN